jgi:ADP-ribose pyrophosphatase YjhB (NUDIX family)
MEINRTLTLTVYVIHENKGLLHMHKKFKSLFPVGGHMRPNELPHETAIREALEESGIEIYDKDCVLPFTKVEQLKRPAYILLENIGKEVENIDFIYFAKTNSKFVKPGISESQEIYLLSEDEINKNMDIKEHIKIMALEALRRVK